VCMVFLECQVCVKSGKTEISGMSGIRGRRVMAGTPVMPGQD